MSSDDMWIVREPDPMPEPTFGRVRRGYDPDEVSEYVSTMTTRIRILEDHAAKLESDLEQARREAQKGAGSSDDPYGAISDRIADAVRSFDQDVQRMRTEAEAEARRVLDEAMANADRTRIDAQSMAEKTLEDAQARADARLSTLESRRRSLLDDLRSIRDRMLESASNLETVLNAQGPEEAVVVPDETVWTS